MKTTPFRPEDLRGVFAVPPLARRADARRALDVEQNGRVLRHMAAGGLRRFLYGGNAFLYHVTLAEYDDMLGWLAGLPDDHWAIPSVGPLTVRHSAPSQVMSPQPLGRSSLAIRPAGAAKITAQLYAR